MATAPNIPNLPVRVAPASTSELVVRGLRTLLEPFQGTIEVTGPTSSGTGSQRRPDVVLLDDVGTEDGGIEQLLDLRSKAPDVPVVLLTDVDDERHLLRTLRAGARGYVLKSRPAADLVADLVRVAGGAQVADPDLAVRAAALAARLVDLDRSPAALLGLTPREVEVLGRLGDGATAREIGAELYVSHETIRSHLKRIYRKLGVHDRPSALRRAQEEGIVGTEPVTPDVAIPADPVGRDPVVPRHAE
jgi:DNA-binding NarL/FixJ family response regulator